MGRKKDECVHVGQEEIRLRRAVEQAGGEIARALGWSENEPFEYSYGGFCRPGIWRAHLHFDARSEPESSRANLGCHRLQILMCAPEMLTIDPTISEQRFALDVPPWYEVRFVRHGWLQQSERALQTFSEPLAQYGSVKFFPADPIAGWVQVVTFGTGTSIRTLPGTATIEPAARPNERVEWQASFETLLEYCRLQTLAEKHKNIASGQAAVAQSAVDPFFSF